MVVTRSDQNPEILANDTKGKRKSKYNSDPSGFSSQGAASDLSEDGMIDIHTFNHFYTYQVDRDVEEENEGVVIDITYEDEATAATRDGYAMRLRAEFNSAEASRAQMAFKATFGYKVYDSSGYYLEELASVSSLNTDEGDGTIAIDLPKLESGYSYQIRYEFSQKQVLKNGQSRSMQEDDVTTGQSLVNCHLPYFTQELVFIDRKLLQQRIKKYNKAVGLGELDINRDHLCAWERLDTVAMDSDEE